MLHRRVEWNRADLYFHSTTFNVLNGIFQHSTWDDTLFNICWSTNVVQTVYHRLYHCCCGCFGFIMMLIWIMYHCRCNKKVWGFPKKCIIYINYDFRLSFVITKFPLSAITGKLWHLPTFIHHWATSKWCPRPWDCNQALLTTRQPWWRISNSFEVWKNFVHWSRCSQKDT